MIEEGIPSIMDCTQSHLIKDRASDMQNVRRMAEATLAATQFWWHKQSQKVQIWYQHQYQKG